MIDPYIANPPMADVVGNMIEGEQQKYQTDLLKNQASEIARNNRKRELLEAAILDDSRWGQFKNEFPIDAAEIDAEREASRRAQVKEQQEQYKQTMEGVKDIYGSSVSLYDKYLENGVDNDQAILKANDFYQERINQMREAGYEIPDDEFDPDVARAIASGIDLDDKEKTTEFFKVLQEYQDELDKVNPDPKKIAALEAKLNINRDKPPTISSPTNADVEAAQTIVDSDEEIDDMDVENEDEMIQWIASRAEEIQKDSGKGRDTALREAKEEAKKMMRPNPGIIDDTNIFDPEFKNTDPSEPVKVTTKEEFDALPVGALYIHPDGNTYRKK